jgi:hypothetical protein
VRRAVLDEARLGDAFGKGGDDGRRAIGAAVVDYEDFVRDVVEAQFEVEVLDG